MYLFTSDLNRNVNNLSFAREGAEAGDDSYPYSLPVAANAAQQLVESFGQRPRHLYAARKIRFERLDGRQGGRVLYFQYASPEIDLYTDEALKSKYMTVRVN